MNIILIAANPDVARRSVNYVEGAQRRRRKRFLGQGKIVNILLKKSDLTDGNSYDLILSF
ncbi:hypothetical protein CKY10_22275 [Photorhabdus sp. HUG-39]|uniref:Uncharacterized protein n=1 Tax=Photorhabdus kayaii TaxID=230088 RepID=A0ABX0B3S6_9GAMM|nr:MULTISPECIES: hypothetical protein [Photorhabdus]MCC8375557.1 hypothetical protein [Photorhabdus bodei]NDL14285.1 hypothetical protein [Photorhabdus kayaii]NDL27800.1 hypothetical protein [Photorhabdus kayaii]RAX06580.1 hypothetical protein CKY10_22275 [Photorhabdus sp. HUG-39]